MALFVNKTYNTNAENNLTLKDLKIKEEGVIKRIIGDKGLKQRIREMGLTPDTKIEVIRVAPLGNPIEIKLKGFLLSLRNEEARNIIITKENN